MTATIRSPDPRDASHALKKNRHARFSSMESLGFIEAPATVSTTWFDPVFSEVKEIPPESPRIKRGAHERTVADLEPNDTSEFRFARTFDGV